MLIGIDGNEANTKMRVGVHQYAFEILKNIHKLNNLNKRKHKFIIFLKKSPGKDLPKENEYWEYKVLSGKNLWILRKLMPYLWFSREKPEVFFTPSHYLPPLINVPSVCTIHDLGYLKFSGQFRKYDFWQLKIWSAISIYISKCIISVSKYTKKDIVRHYPFASEKVVVAPNACDKRRFNPKVSDNDVRRVRKKYGIDDDYILFLSTLKPSKNIDRLLHAFKIVNEVVKEPILLVIAGKKGWLYSSIFKLVKDIGLDKRVVFTDYVKEENKPALIRGAKMLASPSFWEGFGIHVLEAMACGVPVVISDVASLPEVAGKAGVYVDPNDNRSIADGIIRILKLDERGYNEISKKAIEQANNYSWGDSAKKIINTLEKVGG